MCLRVQEPRREYHSILHYRKNYVNISGLHRMPFCRIYRIMCLDHLSMFMYFQFFQHSIPNSTCLIHIGHPQSNWLLNKDLSFLFLDCIHSLNIYILIYSSTIIIGIVNVVLGHMIPLHSAHKAKMCNYDMCRYCLKNQYNSCPNKFQNGTQYYFYNKLLDKDYLK